MILIDGFDLILLQELLESSLEGLEAEIHFLDCVSGIDVDQILIVIDALGRSEFSPGLLD